MLLGKQIPIPVSGVKIQCSGPPAWIIGVQPPWASPRACSGHLAQVARPVCAGVVGRLGLPLLLEDWYSAPEDGCPWGVPRSTWALGSLLRTLLPLSGALECVAAHGTCVSSVSGWPATSSSKFCPDLRARWGGGEAGALFKLL